MKLPAPKKHNTGTLLKTYFDGEVLAASHEFMVPLHSNFSNVTHLKERYTNFSGNTVLKNNVHETI